MDAAPRARRRTALAVDCHELTKRFGETLALDRVSLSLEEGMVLGLLGPNGAGKTTLVRVLATLLAPDGGQARVLGHDVVTDPARVRRLIGLAGQYAAVDEILTGRENLWMFGRLAHLDRVTASRRATELLDRFDLAESADRAVKTYSGGMRRRLDLASCLVGESRVLFLDEPTTGLDPRSRTDMWQSIRQLVAAGTTLLLTTQYLEEADRLADRIAVIDRGAIIAEGTPDELKSLVGGQVVEVRLADTADLPAAVRALSGLGWGEPQTRNGDVVLPASGDAAGTVAAAGRVLSEVGVEVTELGVHRPTLDDVFLTLTEHGLVDDATAHHPTAQEQA